MIFQELIDAIELATANILQYLESLAAVIIEIIRQLGLA